MYVSQNFGYDIDRVPKDQKTGEEVYFEGSKKNQLNDIKKYLKSIQSDPEKEFQRKEIIKKIISYTTIGIDTSRLYPEVVMASATRDPVEKKLVYLYLSIYSNTNQNFARMTINTFLKDISSPNPNVRALAIRSLSNLRFKGRDQYALPTLLNGLNDFVPSVKRSSIMGLVKIAVEHIRADPNHPRDETTLTKFYDLLREDDSSVVCSALEAINEIEEEGLSMSKKLAFYLLGNLHRFNDFQLPVVVGYLQLYDPKNQQQTMEILTTLQPRLKSSNSATVLAISKVFLKLGKNNSSLQDKLLKTLRKSLLSFLHHEVPEIQLIVLRHIEYLIKTLKTQVFHLDYKKFMIGGNEPSYLRATKIRLLKLTTNSQNFADIVNELAEYLFDEDVSYEAVNVLSELVASGNETDAKFIAKTVVKTVQTAPMPTLCDQTLLLVAGFLRLYPKEFNLFSNVFYVMAQNSRQENSRCALFEIIGDFGHLVQDAAELLSSFPATSDRLKISLLRATTKLFLKRPSEMAQNLGKLLKASLNDDETHLQVKDYAAYLYRGLQSGIKSFRAGFLEERPSRKTTPADPEELEFNSLEIMYNAKIEKWLLDPLKFITTEEEVAPEEEPIQVPEEPYRPNVNVDSRFTKLEVENFDITFSMTSEEFERCWEQYEVGSSITRMVNNIEVLGEDNLEQLFKVWNITVLASAESQEQIKLYNYCKVQSAEQDLGTCCMECVFNKQAETVGLMIKSDDQELAGFVSRYITDILKLNEII